MADGYAIGAETVATRSTAKGQAEEMAVLERTSCSRTRATKQQGPAAGEIFRQPDLAATLRKLVETEQQALKKGKVAQGGDLAAYDRFYKGDIAKEFVRGSQEAGRPVHTRTISPTGRCRSRSR